MTKDELIYELELEKLDAKLRIDALERRARFAERALYMACERISSTDPKEFYAGYWIQQAAAELEREDNTKKN